MSFTFIDLFAGLGGFRIGMTRAGFLPVWGSDFNENAAANYEANFGENILSDITSVDESEIPSHNVLCGGFPCQPFSKAGQTLGFEDTRGTLFFDIMRIVRHHKPEVVFLENVKNLASHDGGNTLRVIVDSLKSENYSVSYKVLNAIDFGVPQSRERVIIVASQVGEFSFDSVEQKQRPILLDFLDKEGDFVWLDEASYVLLDEDSVKVQPKTGLKFVGYRKANTRTGQGILQDRLDLSRVHKQPNRIYSAEGTHSTLSSQETAGRYYILAPKHGGGQGVRKLTMAECFRIFGFPDSYVKVGSNSQLYNRIGNSICVPMVEAVAREIRNQLFRA